MKLELEVNRCAKPIFLFALIVVTVALASVISIAESQDKPNILLIVMDATRADHLSCYGYHRKTTPYIDNLAKEGVIYENAYSTAAWSLPSVASMFTSSFPSQHGYHAEIMIVKPEEDIFHVRKELRVKGFDFTLASILNSQGYKTVGFSCCPWVSHSTNLSQGFEEFYQMWRDDVENVNRKVKSWLLNNYKTPFFMYIHYFEPHLLYTPKLPYRNLFIENAEQTLQVEDKMFKVENFAYKYIAREIKLSKEEIKALIPLYDAEIRELDEGINEVIGYLREADILENTLIIITADHGENLGEHQLMDHLLCLYDSLLHVPLIIRYPKLFSPGLREQNLVQTIDIFPTIVEVLRINFNKASKLQGQSLVPSRGKQRIRQFVFAEHESPVEFLKWLNKKRSYFDISKYDRQLKSIRSKDFKYIWSSDGRDELYHIKNDPGELDNIIKKMPKKALQMQTKLEDWLSSFETVNSDKSISIDKELEEKLKSLGYIH